MQRTSALPFAEMIPSLKLRRRPTARLKVGLGLLLCLAGALPAQHVPATPTLPKHGPDVVAGIPVNYDESKVGTYVLPEALTLADGKPVRDPKTWREKRRPEIVRIFETQQYGIAPGRPQAETFEVTEKATPALQGVAIRRQVTIHLFKEAGTPEIHLLEYLPAKATRPVPVLLSISFGAIQNAVDDPGIAPQKVWDAKTRQLIVPPPERGFGRLEIEPLLKAGFAVATFYYGDVEPDYLDAAPNGVRARYSSPGQTSREPDAWGAVSAWAWGMSRVEDYFETDKDVDARRVAIHGVSRLGKTVMWAGAHDERFAAIIASCSGEGGAALSRRNYGETIAHLTEPARYPYQFAANYAKYAGFPDTAPMDANLLVALIAPRPLLLQTGNTDFWSDPKGEFLAEVAAEPVYRLLGKQGLGTDVWPVANVPIFHDLSYFMHDGGHGMLPGDLDVYIEFLKTALMPAQR